ncbi:hypothetical protein ACO34A_02000 [Rhizobium sp. ACO-34A]|nr:hypothetical protein ACO34A_02000 [Rhizobium sp. ACO-34A]
MKNLRAAVLQINVLTDVCGIWWKGWAVLSETSIPLACQDRANTKVASHFFSNDRVGEWTSSLVISSPLDVLLLRRPVSSWSCRT